MRNNIIFEHKEFFENIIAYTKMGISVTEYDETANDFKLVLCNNAFYKHNSFLQGDVIGRYLTEVFPLCKQNGMYDSNIRVHQTGNPVEFTLSYVDPVRGNVYQRFQIFKLGDKFCVCMFNDITDIKNSEEAVKLEQIKYRQTLNSLACGVITTDHKNRITLINRYAAKLLEVKVGDVYGRFIDDVYKVGRSTSSKLLDTLVDDFETQTIICPNGIKKLVVHRVTTLMDDSGKNRGYVYSFEDVSKFVKAQEDLMYMNYHDLHTGFYNRVFLKIFLARNMVKRGLGVISADINGLGRINDMYGTDTGDELLKKCADAFKTALPQNSILVRFGEDDFIAIVYTTSETELIRAALQIKNDYEDTCWYANSSLSMGTSLVGVDADNIKDAIRISQDKMNSQKIMNEQSVRSSALLSLLATLQVKSHETEEHAQRLNSISSAFAKRLNLNEKQQNQLALLSVLHDVGKIGVPEFVLDKPGELTDEEWKIMRNHANLGNTILLSTPELSHIAPFVRAHHERWDGKGYPDGLEGEEIPLLARIISIVDAYDAMVNDRVYRKALTEEEAINEILKNAGTQFDPNIVDIFVEIIRENA